MTATLWQQGKQNFRLIVEQKIIAATTTTLYIRELLEWTCTFPRLGFNETKILNRPA